MARFLYITKAEYAGGLSPNITFSDNTERLIDFASFFSSNTRTQYNKYCNPDKSKKFYLDHGNVVWGEIGT